MTSTRREFIGGAAAAALGALVPGGLLAAEEKQMQDRFAADEARWRAIEAPDGISQEQIKAMVFPSHGNLDVVKAQLSAEPRLVQVRLLEFDEAPIEAASHTGNVEIAEYLLARGARFKIQCACMLGMVQAVSAFLDERPELATQPGAHKLPLMYHAAHSGKVEVLELLSSRGGGQDYGFALHSAAELDRPHIAEWLLSRGADLDETNFKGLTPLQVAEEREHTATAQVLRDATARRGGAG
jgi:hypothetical protein